MLRYSSGTSIPISEEASVATNIHSIAARPSEISFKYQLWVTQCFKGRILVLTQPGAQPFQRSRTEQARPLFALAHRAGAAAMFRDRDTVPSRRHVRTRSRPFPRKR